MDCSTPGFPVHQQLLEFAQTHVYPVGDAIQLDGHESEQTSGDSEGQGGLACRSPWGRKEPDMT